MHGAPTARRGLRVTAADGAWPGMPAMGPAPPFWGRSLPGTGMAPGQEVPAQGRAPGGYPGFGGNEVSAAIAGYEPAIAGTNQNLPFFGGYKKVRGNLDFQ